MYTHSIVPNDPTWVKKLNLREDEAFCWYSVYLYCYIYSVSFLKIHITIMITLPIVTLQFALGPELVMERISTWVQTRSVMLESHVILQKQNKERRKLEIFYSFNIDAWIIIKCVVHTYMSTSPLRSIRVRRCKIKLFEDLASIIYYCSRHLLNELEHGSSICICKYDMSIIRRCSVTWCYYKSCNSCQ